MISMPKFENKVCSGIHFSETLRLRRVHNTFRVPSLPEALFRGGDFLMWNINLRMVILPFNGEQMFRSMRGRSQVKTKHSFSEQKMSLWWALLEISGLGRVITRFDPRLSQEHCQKGGILQ